jgi:DNA-binding HxlR family transcriptional regulator
MARQDSTFLLRGNTQGTKVARSSPTEPEQSLAQACPRVSGLLSRIGDKWTVLVVMLLREGPRRFSELKREIGGISQRMLTSTLRGLERDGLVTRTVYPTTPPRVDYALTRLGHSLREPVEALGEWALAHLDVIEDARREFDDRAAVTAAAPPRDATRVVTLKSRASSGRK